MNYEFGYLFITVLGTVVCLFLWATYLHQAREWENWGNRYEHAITDARWSLAGVFLFWLWPILLPIIVLWWVGEALYETLFPKNRK